MTFRIGSYDPKKPTVTQVISRTPLRMFSPCALIAQLAVRETPALPAGHRLLFDSSLIFRADFSG